MNIEQQIEALRAQAKALQDGLPARLKALEEKAEAEAAINAEFSHLEELSERIEARKQALTIGARQEIFAEETRTFAEIEELEARIKGLELSPDRDSGHV